MASALFDQLEVGSRATIRARRPDGGARDFVGWIVSTTPQTVTIETALNTTTRISVREIIAARKLPPARGGKAPIRESVERIIKAAQLHFIRRIDGWGQLDAEADEVWLAMSPDAPTHSEGLRDAHSLVVACESPLEQELLGSGWLSTGDRGWDVYVCSLNAALSGQTSDDVKTVRTPVAASDVLTSVEIRSEQDRSLLATGTYRDDWVSIALASPGSSHSAAAVSDLCRWAARLGGRNAVAVVAHSNSAASSTFEALGFALHHRQHLLSRARPQPKH